jgi:TRAP-type C4-dicarboxylate transport system permease small subunit
MPAEPTTLASSPPANVLARIARGLAVLGGCLVVVLAFLVTLSVLLRWQGSQGINGDFELVQMGLALAVFAFLPLCQARRGNVMVDTFTLRLPAPLQAGLDAVWDLVYAGFAGFIAWRLSIGAWEAHASHTTSMVLGLPIHFAIGVCAAIAAFLAVVAVSTAVLRVRGAA